MNEQKEMLPFLFIFLPREKQTRFTIQFGHFFLAILMGTTEPIVDWKSKCEEIERWINNEIWMKLTKVRTKSK